uniref:Uncharacterized protein n=1 Tax=Arundo donax TaxID=35708 RepID=A0A0A9B226_ARUDO
MGSVRFRLKAKCGYEPNWPLVHKRQRRMPNCQCAPKSQLPWKP